MPFVEGVVSSLVASAIGRVGNQVLVTAARLRGKEKAKELEAAKLLTGFTFSDSSLRAMVELPPDITADDIDELITKPACEAIAFECLAAVLTDAPEQTILRARQRWLAVTTTATLSQADAWRDAKLTVEEQVLQRDEFYGERPSTRISRATPSETANSLFDVLRTIPSATANSLFDVLLAQTRIAVSIIREQFPDTYARFRNEAFYSRISYTLDNIARRNGLNDLKTEESIGIVIRNYKDHVRKAHQYLTPPDFDRRRFIPLEELYVSPTIVDDRNPADKLGKTLEEYIDRTVLLGDPGNGKSTASQVVMHRLAGMNVGPVPFLVVLRDFASPRPKSSVIDYLEARLSTFYQYSMDPTIIEYLLQSGQALVIFDGLDELLDPSARREVTDAVSNFCNAYPTSRVLVTSRRVGYYQAPMDPHQFSVLQLAEFDDDQASEYVEKWFKLDEELEGNPKEWADAFIAESAVVADLRSNPLLLALMCILYRGERSIPKNRPAVYEQCAEMLFKKWDSHRGISVSLQAVGVVDTAMKHLAYWMFTTPNTSDGVTKTELVRETTSYLLGRVTEEPEAAEQAAREFVEFCHGRAWVFTDVGTTPDGEPLYKFTHRTFLEYFAAFHLVRQADSPEILAKQMLPRVANEEWDVVGQLAVQIMDKRADRGADRLYVRMLADRRHRTSSNRRRIYTFLAKCLEFAQVSPGTVRELTVNIIHNVREDSASSDCLLAFGHLELAIEDPRRSVVGEALREWFGETTTSGAVDDQLFALRVAATSRSAGTLLSITKTGRDEHFRSVMNAWRSFGDDLLQARRELILEFAGGDGYMRILAMGFGWLDLSSYLGPAKRLDALLSDSALGIGDIRFRELGDVMVNAALRPAVEPLFEASRDRYLEILEELGLLIMEGQIQFDTFPFYLNFPSGTYVYRSMEDLPELSSLQVLGLGVLLIAVYYGARAGGWLIEYRRPGKSSLDPAYWFSDWYDTYLSAGGDEDHEATVEAFIGAWQSGALRYTPASPSDSAQSASTN
jgi:hypothetical protein